MIILLGASGYVGSAFGSLLTKKGLHYLAPSRDQLNYSDPEILSDFLTANKATFLINAAGYTGRPNVDACEVNKTECLFGNTVMPGRVAEACKQANIPWGHVSSGCIFTGSRPDGSGFTEKDEPNFTFRQNNCSFYSGSKALGEELLSKYDNVYIWRLRIPFDNNDGARNYISKLLRYSRLLDATNSISHLGEFVESSFACWERRIPTGIYHVTNPGQITTRQVVELMLKHNLTSKRFEFFESESEFMAEAASTPRSNCIMNSQKLVESGIMMTPVVECLERCMQTWRPE